MKTIYNLSIYSLFSILIMLNFSCSNNDDEVDIIELPANMGEEGSITCAINGTSFTSFPTEDLTNAKITNVIEDTVITSTLFINGGGQTQNVVYSIAINIASKEDNFVLGEGVGAYDGVVTNNLLVTAVVAVQRNGDRDEASTTDNLKVTIAEIDLENMLVSGTFEFEATSSTTQELYKVLNGVFLRIPITQ